MVKKNFRPTKEMVDAAMAVFTAMALVDIIRPTVEAYKKKVLAELQAGPDPRWCKGERGMSATDIILDPKHAYLLGDADFQTYSKRCDEERRKAGLHVADPKFCPLLVAEELKRKAERVLIETMQPITGISVDAVLRGPKGLEHYRRFVELTLKLLGPYVKRQQG